MPSCLVCGKTATDLHHWPEQVGMGRSRKKHPELPTVSMCRRCHDSYHDGNERVTLTLIERAPEHWRERGEWENAQPYYQRFVDRWEYRRGL